jgi:hypothetical protein
LIQTLVIALPGLAALIVCIRRGPERALLDIYLPTLLMFPQAFTWPTSLRLPSAATAILPIGLFLLFRPQHKWQWGTFDFLVIGYIAITAVSESINLGYKFGQQLAVQEFISVFLPYFAIKQTIRDHQFAVEFAKRIAILFTMVAIVSVYEFRMGSNLFLRPFAGIFPLPPAINVMFRGGFMRTQGPYGHSIAAGMVMAAGFCIAYWLDRSGSWPGQMPFLPISKIRFCELWIIAGSIMTLSIGPWLGFAGALVALSVCLARDRKRALALLIFATLVVGLPGASKFQGYVSGDTTWSANASDSQKLQEDGAYRRKLVEVYVPVIEERPTWGWGPRMFPVTAGMWSIDDGYLLMALSYGLYALGLFVAILAWTPIRLCALGLRLPRHDPAALAAFSLMGVYVLIAISLASTSLDNGANGHLFFLVSGWSAALLKSDATEMAVAGAVAPQPRTRLAFRRVMA